MKSDKADKRPDFASSCRFFVGLALVLAGFGIFPDLKVKELLPERKAAGEAVYRWGMDEGTGNSGLYRSSSMAEPAFIPQPLPEKLKPFFHYPMDVNRVSVELLQTVPGIGEALAGRIVRARQRQGAFHRLDELGHIPGIGQAKLARLKRYLTTDSAPIFLPPRNFSYPTATSRSVRY